jgi:phage head maturation protease
MTKVATKPIEKTEDLDGGKDKAYEAQHIKAFYDPETKTAIASTDSVDRMGEVIEQSGWDLGNFKNNPVLLWAHDDRLPRIGLAQNLRIEKANGKSALMFEPKFNEATELSRAIKQIFEDEGGTFSVGFMPLEMDGNTYTKAELLEISAVNVPANQDAMMLAYRTLRQRGISAKVAKQVTGVKGAVADAVADGDMTWNKYEKMDDVFDIFYAFCDVYFAPQAKVGDFSDLLNECIGLLQQVADGTYVDPDMDDVVENSLMAKVLDRRANRSKDKGNQAKVPSAAPKRKHVEERLAMAKIIAKAADILAKDEKLPDTNRKSVIKVINRASDIMVEQHKGELNHG